MQRDPPSNSLAGRDSGASAIDKLFRSLACGDLAALRSLFAPDARIWHNFDCVALSLDQACGAWSAFVATFPERCIADVERIAIPGGFVQRHLQVVRDAAGVQKTWPVCIFVKLQNCLITRLDEYLDRAGSLLGAHAATPGLR